MTGETVATKLAHWVHGLELAQVPNETVHAARRALLDTIGVITAGARHPITAKTRSAFLQGVGAASVTAGGTATPASAALINGCAAHAYDFDDVSHTGILHGSAVIAPAVLAAMEQVGCGDDKALTAFIAGSEVCYLLGDALTHHHFLKGWWTTCTPFLCGFTAKTAVEFALAVNASISGPTDAFENESGFVTLLNDGQFDHDVLETCGEPWRLLEPGLLFKRYPVCSSAQAIIEESAVMKESYGFSIDEIVEVECRVPDVVAQSLVYDDPQTPQQCQFSVPYSVACGFHHGGINLSHIAAGAGIDAELRTTMDKVRWQADAELSTEAMRLEFPECAKIVVHLRDSRVIEGFRPLATGMPAAPLSDDGLVEKFRSCLSFGGVSEECADSVAQTLLKLGGKPDEQRLAETIRELWGRSTGTRH
jgi:2-methylcitrate dehydratase PrpD